ncbi:TetR family transcriptional regulator [Shewanella xiamenensis]|uniref:TetR/AcrR family transcriptional regulator n=1 Tax=Shewanella TaxID=22 RepID=UPI001184D396|nr:MULTISPECIES: TetR/AcrR family transcriptional regulator [Shewanella]MCH7423685.1 TetR/AcrR family transcriptional regulator [Shewanella sp. MM_2022_3]TVL17615.1 TetR family transcriptional regulator [Shewanella xiamenensis]TVL18335.1 TetR family transcriptional regulator [Shewanella xiamenensis]TVL25283.1 TetR family transcriptional regulator [Shewanella xiamenensis]TVL31260.1 TetR family transcriptional regulator [Shewanella xiamenensis]
MSSLLPTDTDTKPMTDKRQAILDTALSLFVSQGFHATSTASIAKQASVATGTLFHHFPTKEVLMESLFLTIKQEFANALLLNIKEGSDLKEHAEILWQSAIDWSIDNPIKQLFFQQYSMSPMIAASIREQAMNSILGFIAQLIKKGQLMGLIAHYPIELMLENCHGQYLAATRFFIDNPELGRDKHYRDASFALFWKALRAD